jgi:hypothetical protein
VIHAAKPRYTAAAAREHGLVLEPSLLTPGASVTSPFHTLRRWWTYGNLGTGHLHLNDFDKAVEAQHTMAISLKLAHMQSKAALSVYAGAFAARALLQRVRCWRPLQAGPDRHASTAPWACAAQPPAAQPGRFYLAPRVLRRPIVLWCVGV